jgi:mutator protein MutT
LRSFPERPIVGVGAVVLNGDHVLLVKRAHEPLKGEWSLPGGVVEVGETLQAALVREVYEETALKIHVGPVVEVFERIHTAPDGRTEFHFVIVDYLCHPAGGDAPTRGSDAEDVRWVEAADLARYQLTDKAASVIAKARQLVATPGTPAPRGER